MPVKTDSRLFLEENWELFGDSVETAKRLANERGVTYTTDAAFSAAFYTVKKSKGGSANDPSSRPSRSRPANAKSTKRLEEAKTKYEAFRNASRELVGMFKAYEDVVTSLESEVESLTARNQALATENLRLKNVEARFNQVQEALKRVDIST